MYLFSTGIRVSQLVAGVSFVLAVLTLVQNYRRRHRRPLYVLRKAAAKAKAAAEAQAAAEQAEESFN